jgi:ring-1,2-phenylacetyl-CoA epoxidase subunit PaaD
MAWLAQVPDPEIPVLSLTDLGVVRDLRWEGDTLVAAITPTYSGCPATAVIEMSAAAALTARLAPLGLAARIERRLSPPWTTDWIGPAARACRARALPPLRRRPAGAGEPVRLDAVQGAVALPRLPRTLRPLQVPLTPSEDPT